MNFELSDEQVFLQEAARDALARHGTVEAARAAADGGELPDLWPTAREAGWTGLVVDEARGGAGLGAFEAMLVMAECGRVLASVPLLGHVPATGLLDAAADADAGLLGRLAAGKARAAYLPTRPPDDLIEEWTVDPPRGTRRHPAPILKGSGARARLTGQVSWVPDAPGADVLVGVAIGARGRARAFVVEAGARGVSVESVRRYDATRSLGHVTFDGTPVTLLDVPESELAAAWYLAQGLIAGESFGSVEECLQRSVAYAKERFTFGRAIGSYQAIKHQLSETLRLLENARSLIYYAGWARDDRPEEFATAASAARVGTGRAFDYASREHISVHGGIGATWEHDAPFFFRRAQLSRRLLAGTNDAADRVASELLAAARLTQPAVRSAEGDAISGSGQATLEGAGTASSGPG